MAQPDLDLIMSAPTDPIADIERVAFVTQRFHELRGLMPASFGGALIVAALMVHAAGTASSFGSGPFQALIFANCVYVLAMITLDRSYRQTFGDVVATPRQRFTSGLLPFVVMSGALCDMLLRSVSRQGPSIAALAFASYAAWIASRDWRWRMHYLAAVAAGITAALVTAAVPGTLGRWGDMDPARAEAFLLAYTLIGLGMVAVSLFDHALIAAALRPSTAEPQLDAHPARGVALRTFAAASVIALTTGGFVMWRSDAAPVALPAVLMVALIFTQVIVAVPDAIRAARELNSGGRVTLRRGRVLHLKPDDLVLLFLLALAAAAESILGTRGFLALTLSLSMAWIAVRDWPHRKGYLVAAAGAAAIALLTRNIDSARAFAMLVCAASVGIMLEALITYRTGTRNVDTI
jgi:hypothetical protein